MSADEKRAWIQGIAAVGAYAAYLIVTNIVVGMASPRDAGKKDERDKEIHRVGELTGHGLLVLGAVAALVLAMGEIDHFWFPSW